MKKLIFFSYNHEYPDNLKFLLQTNGLTKNLETLIQKKSDKIPLEEKKKKFKMLIMKGTPSIQNKSVAIEDSVYNIQ